MDGTTSIQNNLCNYEKDSLLNILSSKSKPLPVLEPSKRNNKSWNPAAFIMGSYRKPKVDINVSRRSSVCSSGSSESSCSSSSSSSTSRVRRKSITARKSKNSRYGKGRRLSREEKKNIYNMFISRLIETSGSSMLMVMGNGSGGSGSNSPSNGTTNGTSGHTSPQNHQLSPDSTNPTVTISRNNSSTGAAATTLDSNNRQSLKHLSVSAPAMRTVNRAGTVGEAAFPPSSSKSRQKKFHRHFKQVSQDEKVLDYYSCALVADILLQGYLYITENHFAFYSNVFGYVTKVLIPVSSVIEISKEKTAKIIPNAVGVRTTESKHVFASLLSRDTTYKLMQKVWNHSEKQEAAEVSRLKERLLLEASSTGSDTHGIPDESSGDSGSGNDSAIEQPSCTPSPLNTPSVEKTIKIGKPNINSLHSTNSLPAQVAAVELTNHTATVTTTTSNTKPVPAYLPTQRTSVIDKPNLTSFRGENTSLSATTGVVSSSKGPSLLVLATALLVILFFSAALLLSRISNLQQRLSERPALRDSEQFYQELLTWQNKLHSSSADEIHQYINSNLQQIIKVRESLEALSLLFMNRPESGIIQESSSSSISNKES